MQIPVTWETKTETVFTMLVVSGLVCPILFGENHLYGTQALVDHYAPSITFRHPSMPFRVQCSFDNPFEGFASVSAPNGFFSHESGPTVPKPHVSATCLLTLALPPSVHKRSQTLHRGLDFVTVCVTLSAALKCIWTENSFYAVINFHLWNTPFRSLRRLGWKLAMLQAFKVTLFALKNGLQIARPKGQNVTWCDVILVARSVQYLVWRFFSTYFNFLLVPWSLSNR